jgi:hypothetical protein
MEVYFSLNNMDFLYLTNFKNYLNETLSFEPILKRNGVAKTKNTLLHNQYFYYGRKGSLSVEGDVSVANGEWKGKSLTAIICSLMKFWELKFMHVLKSNFHYF